MISKHQTIDDLLKHNSLLEVVLSRFDIQNDEKGFSLAVIADMKNFELDFFIEILNLFDGEPPRFSENFEKFDATTVIEYLEKTHQYYLGKRLFELERSVNCICEEYYQDAYLSTLLKNFFNEFKKELWSHIELEEIHLFPYIKYLLTPIANIDRYEAERKLKNFSLIQFAQEHDDNSENDLSEIIQILSYLFPNDRFFSPVSILKKQLQSFEKDLKVHTLVEDEILMPKAFLLENNLKNYVLALN